MLSFVLRQVGIEQQAGHTDDGVHRRPDLMAHVGQELALGFARRFRRFLGFFQLFGVPAPEGVGDDLADDAQQRDGVLRPVDLVPDRGERQIAEDLVAQ